MNREAAHSISKLGRLGEGRPTKRTPQVVVKIAEAVATGLTDEEAALLGTLTQLSGASQRYLVFTR